MRINYLLAWGGALAAALGLAACNAPATTTAAVEPAIPATNIAAPTEMTTNPAQPAAVQSALPKILVHKSPSCGCCSAWVDHLRHTGFEVQVDETDELEPIRKRLGVPYAKGSCHTAEVGGYVVEGHVPAADIKRLLFEGPKAKGLVLPGMPMGSPGMESPDGRVAPYTVELIGMNGTTTAYAQHGQ